jgi:hypothetical protein
MTAPAITRPTRTQSRPSPFAVLDLQQIKERLGVLVVPDYETVRAFYDGDHWQEGDGWTGPAPITSEVDTTGLQETWDELERGFVSRNVILEGVDRHVGGVLGNEPEWRLVPRRPLGPTEKPTEAELNAAVEAATALTEWWNARKVHEVLRRITAVMLLGGRAPARLYVPSGRLVEAPSVEEAATTPEPADTADTADTEGTAAPLSVAPALMVPAQDLASGLDAVFLTDPDPNVAGVITDPDTMWEAGVYTYKRDDREIIELAYLDAQAGTDAQGRPETVLETIDGDNRTRYPQPWGGRLPIAQVERPRLVTDQVCQLQRTMNLALSILPKNLITGGFLERVLIDAQMPGEWQRDPATGNRLKFIPGAYYTGPGTTNFVVGADIEQPDGTVTKGTPNVVWREPIDPTPTVNGERAVYRSLLEEFKQAHVLMNSDAGASGVSREQARDDFRQSLNLTAGAVNGLGRWLLETALAMAEAFAGAPGRWTDQFRVDFTCHVDTGPLSSDEQQAVMTAVDKQMIARNTGRARLGIQDVDAEQAEINAQPDAQLDLLQRQFTVMALATAQGISAADAAEALGMDEKFLALLRAAPDLPDPNSNVPPVQ